MFEKIAFIIITILLVINAHFAYNFLYIKNGTVIEVKGNILTIRDSHHHDHTFHVEKETGFYDKQGNKISFSDLKTGENVRIYLTPWSYYKAIYSKGGKTARWIKKLS